MSNLSQEISQEDLSILSAMLDGEIEKTALDTLLARMAVEPALGKAWMRLSQIQAASHRHAQVGFHVDLSDSIRQKLESSAVESVPTPVVEFKRSSEPKPSLTKPSLRAVNLIKPSDISTSVQQLRQTNSVLQTKASYQGADRRKTNTIAQQAQLIQSSKKKGFKKQLLAHLAVAASVASITVWIQNAFITGSMFNEASIVAQESAQVTTGAVPAALRDAQDLPMATVGAATQEPVRASIASARLESGPVGNEAANDATETPLQVEMP